MVSLPVGRMEVVRVAVLVPLPAGLSVAMPRLKVPLVKVTFPVGLGPLPVTVAVKVTAWPDTDVLGADTTVVVLLMTLGLTTCVSGGLLLVAKLVSPK